MTWGVSQTMYYTQLYLRKLICLPATSESNYGSAAVERCCHRQVSYVNRKEAFVVLEYSMY